MSMPNQSQPPKAEAAPINVVATSPSVPPALVVTATHFEAAAGPFHVQLVFGTRFVVGGSELRRDEVGLLLPLATAKFLHMHLGELLQKAEGMFGPISIPNVPVLAPAAAGAPPGTGEGAPPPAST